jgi:hypothetical protein
MLQETFNDDDQVHLYKYLLQQQDEEEEEESLPELASVTTNSVASSLRVISMEESPVKKGRRESSASLLRVQSPRRRRQSHQSFGWSHTKRQSSSNSSPLSPYLKHDNETRLQQQVVSLKRQLQQAQQEVARKTRSHEEALISKRQQKEEYEQRLQKLQQEHELELQQLDEYQSVLLNKLRQRDEELEARELEIDRLRDLLQHRNEQQQLQTNDSLQTLEEHASLKQSQDEQESLEQHPPHVRDVSSVQLNEMIDECQRELHEFGMELGLEQQQHDYANVPREIQTTRQEHDRQECPYYHSSSSMMVSSSVDVAQSLVRMLQEESLSNEEELAIWEKLATLSEHFGNDDFSQHGDTVASVVPLELYQRMECKCNTLEQEQRLLKQEFLEVIQSSRTAHALQFQIMISEIQEEAQRQVQLALNGKQGGMIDLSNVSLNM